MTDIDKIRERAEHAAPYTWKADILAMVAELARLREYVEDDCLCPCCDTTRHCIGECTFRQDAPDAAERMQAARIAMWGTI